MKQLETTTGSLIVTEPKITSNIRAKSLLLYDKKLLWMDSLLVKLGLYIGKNKSTITQIYGL